MLSDFTGAEKVYIACGYTDLRKGIDVLAALVQSQFQLDPFTNTQRRFLVYESAIYNLSINNIPVGHQRHISHLFCPVDTAVGEAGFGKEVVVNIFIGE